MDRDQLILKKLEKMEKDIGIIRNNMVYINSIMSEEDYLALREYRKEKAEGTLVSHEELVLELDA